MDFVLFDQSSYDGTLVDFLSTILPTSPAHDFTHWADSEARIAHQSSEILDRLYSLFHNI